MRLASSLNATRFSIFFVLTWSAECVLEWLLDRTPASSPPLRTISNPGLRAVFRIVLLPPGYREGYTAGGRRKGLTSGGKSVGSVDAFGRKVSAEKSDGEVAVLLTVSLALSDEVGSVIVSVEER
jgi:hypothetical protein